MLKCLEYRMACFNCSLHSFSYDDMIGNPACVELAYEILHTFIFNHVEWHKASYKLVKDTKLKMIKRKKLKKFLDKRNGFRFTGMNCRK